MRRRSDTGSPPADLVVFDGRRYRTSAAWCSAFEEFRAAREAWSSEHEGAELPTIEVNGHEPFDRSRFER